jgi:hypothetical protein
MLTFLCGSSNLYRTFQCGSLIDRTSSTRRHCGHHGYVLLRVGHQLPQINSVRVPKESWRSLVPVCTTTKPAAPRFAVFEAWAPRSRHNARLEQATAVSYEQKTRQPGKKHPRIFANAKSNETFPQPRTTKNPIPVTSNLYSDQPMRPH